MNTRGRADLGEGRGDIELWVPNGIWEIISDWLFYMWMVFYSSSHGGAGNGPGLSLSHFITHFAPPFKASFYKLRTIVTTSLTFYFENKKSQSTDENSLTFKDTK